MSRALPAVVLAVAALVLGSSSAQAAAPKKSKASAAASKVQNCGRNLNCLRLAANTCALAKADSESKIQMMGVERKTTSRLEILGRDGDRCIFKTTEIASSMKLGPEVRRMIASQGKSAAEINRGEREENQKLAKNLGQTRTCRIAPTRLAQVLARWNNGAYSTNDLPAKDCK